MSIPHEAFIAALGGGRNSAADPLRALPEWLPVESGARPAPDACEWAESLESRYGVRLPEEFRAYVLEAAPSEEGIDAAGTMWWPPSRIRSIPDEFQGEIDNPVIAAEAGAYLFFADYLVWCWAWAICCSDGPNRGRVAFIGGPDDFVAESFSGFVERYLCDPDGTANTMPERTDER